MTQEEKQLLLVDLSARFPYNVAIDCRDEDSRFICYLTTDILREIQNNTCYWEYKPYLFPLSSMTEEQRKEFDDLTKVLHEFMKNHAKGNDVTERFFYTQIELWKLKTDWLNKNNFDYRGLIPMGLAIDATGLNIY